MCRRRGDRNRGQRAAAVHVLVGKCDRKHAGVGREATAVRGKLREKKAEPMNQRLVTGCSFSAINGATLSSSVRTKHGVM